MLIDKHAQRTSQLHRRRKPLFGSLAKQFVDDVHKLLRQIGPNLMERSRFRLDMLHRQGDRRVAGKGGASREHVVSRCAQGVKVAARVDR